MRRSVISTTRDERHGTHSSQARTCSNVPTVSHGTATTPSSIPRRFLPLCGCALRLPRQPRGQDVMERAADGLSDRSMVRRELERGERAPSQRGPAADQRRTGRERGSRVDSPGGGRPRQGRQALRAAVPSRLRPQPRQPLHRQKDPRLLPPHPQATARLIL